MRFKTFLLESFDLLKKIKNFLNTPDGLSVKLKIDGRDYFFETDYRVQEMNSQGEIRFYDTINYEAYYDEDKDEYADDAPDGFDGTLKIGIKEEELFYFSLNTDRKMDQFETIVNYELYVKFLLDVSDIHDKDKVLPVLLQLYKKSLSQFEKKDLTQALECLDALKIDWPELDAIKKSLSK